MEGKVTRAGIPNVKADEFLVLCYVSIRQGRKSHWAMARRTSGGVYWQPDSQLVFPISRMGKVCLVVGEKMVVVNATNITMSCFFYL